MKYAFMSFSTPNLTFAEMLEVATRYGYDGVEPRIDAKHAHGVEVHTSQEERCQIRRLSEDMQIQIACLATSLKYANPEETEQMIDQTHERIDLAGDVGAPIIRVFGGRIPSEISREDAIELVSESLCRVAEHAAERGVVICLETHDDWCDPRHVAAVLAKVNHPAVAANWDIMHPVKRANCTIDEAFDVLKPWIKHLHIHDGTDAGLVPIGTGDIDHRCVVQLLKTVGYEGFLSGEWINWEAYDVHLPRELATMRQYEEEN